METIYAVGVIKADLDRPDSLIHSQRLLHLFSSFEEAEKFIFDEESIFEYFYNLALIEEIKVVPKFSNLKHSLTYYQPPPQWWYKVESIDGSWNVQKIPQPKCVQNLCNIWVG